jgi:hypothetical protein
MEEGENLSMLRPERGLDFELMKEVYQKIHLSQLLKVNQLLNKEW